MSGRIQYEVWLMALSLVTGAWLMLAYDTLRVFRLVIRHGSFWMGVEDFIYWLYAGLVTFILLYEQNDGVFRAYVVGGVFLGMILYDRFISRIFCHSKHVSINVGTCDNKSFGAQFMKAFCDLFNFIFRISVFDRVIGQKTCFCDIRNYNICTGA